MFGKLLNKAVVTDLCIVIRAELKLLLRPSGVCRVSMD